MPLSRRSRILIALPVLLAAYLAIVACWAYAAFDAVLAGAEAGPGTGLTARQTTILTLVEDPSFFQHRGVSLGRGQGLATISSAVARDVYLYGVRLQGTAGLLQGLYRGVFGCCRKIDLGRDVMAVVLDARLSKERQLAIYVDQVYMGSYDGRQLRGLGQASMQHFGKPLGATTEDEFTALAAMIKAPNNYHPLRNPAAHQARLARVRALVAGTCRPSGWFDTALEHCGAP